MPSKALFDVEAMRALAKERVEITSLRAVAGEVPMSKSGLEAFLSGRNPYSATRPKLAAWYVRNRRQAPPTESEIESALAILARYSTHDERPDMREKRFVAINARLAQAIKR